MGPPPYRLINKQKRSPFYPFPFLLIICSSASSSLVFTHYQFGAAEGRAKDMLDSIRVLEFYCGIGMSGQLIHISYCECMEQCQKQWVHLPRFLMRTNLLVL